MEIKPISSDSVPRALELAQRYRLLGEPEQAASICTDVLAADPGNAEARLVLFLATTEQFSLTHGPDVEDADRIVAEMPTEYERAYYGGVARERWARSRLQAGVHTAIAGDWLRRAMELYAEAERVRPAGNDDALLRWNACQRLIQRVPALALSEDATGHYGD